MTEIPKPELPTHITDQHFSGKQANTVETFWDNQATLPGYQSVVVDDDNHTSTRMLYNYLSTQIDFKDMIILDVGCGVGRIFPIYLEFGAAEIHGVDISYNMLKIARFKYPHPNIMLYKMDAANLYGLADNSFDLIMCITVLAHITSETAIAQAIHETIRVTKPGGHIVIIEPMSFNNYELYQHSNMVIRPSRGYLNMFVEKVGTSIEHNSRECFGSPDHQDAWRNVMIFRKNENAS